MSESKKKRRVRTLTDAYGNNVPAKDLRKDIVERDTLVNRVFKRVERLEAHIRKEKGKIDADIEKYLDKRAETVGQDWKGNAVLTSFDKQLQVRVNYSDRIAYNESIQLAQQLVSQCLEEWMEGADARAKALVKRAFRSDKSGRISRTRLLELKEFSLKSAKWEQAMRLIDDAAEVVATKQYTTFHRRGKAGKWEQVSLNYSSK